ncbi:hypothetical protein [Legionella londiniensis]|uniref:Uncharacterized protein n=1 Tax=Legionella londiniensis TaxID=45068 RepID=A0A0W0VP08_9GAMM|nr:hypothetical protein [Legionella londiniensis]KTD21904.1 hypothetical protein Llon_1069 [Legionella londiniensis]STX92613.1 Uncharacterised protein [Legionella londiniensis]
MKQLAMLFVAGFMALSLVACGGQDKQKQPEVRTETTATQPEQTPEQAPAATNTENQGADQGAADNQTQE